MARRRDDRALWRYLGATQGASANGEIMTRGRIAALALTGLLGSIGALTTVPPPAGAAAPTYERGDTLSWNCTIDEDPLVEMRGVLDALSESRVQVFVQLDDGFLAPDFEKPADLTITDGSVSGTIPMLRFTPGEEPVPARAASIDLALTPLGERVRDRTSVSNNDNVRSSTIAFTQPVAVSGSVTVNGTTYSDVPECVGAHETFTTRTTNPDTRVAGIGSGSTYDAHCVLGDSEGALELIRDGKESVGFFETFSEENFVFGAIEEATWRPGTLRGTYTLEEGGSGTATASVEQGVLVEQFDIEDTLGPFRRMVHVERYDAAGRLVLPDGTTWALTCDLEISKGIAILHSPSGPRVTNDTSADAAPLAAGDRVELKTGRAAPIGEIGTECAQSEFSRTVWYSVDGAGGEVTLDTAGSDFDTVLAVYVVTDGELAEIACGNDDEDRFATTAWTTRPGVRYLVQVGGVDGQSGNLVLTRS